MNLMRSPGQDITTKVTIRARIMWAMVLLTLLSLATSGAIVAIVPVVVDAYLKGFKGFDAAIHVT